MAEGIKNLNSEKPFTIVRESTSGNWLVTLAIGEKYLERWKRTVAESWILYAELNNLGIIVITDHLISQNDKHWKKPNWQKLLIAKTLNKYELGIKLICYLDTDILINPYSKNVFLYYKKNKVGVVSLRKNLPFNYDNTLRKLALLRNKYIDVNYPLDSALFISLKDLYEYHKLPIQDDEFCSGLLLFDPITIEGEMHQWFFVYDQEIKTITNGGDQTHINYHIFSSNLANVIPYEFQAIWSFESANYYPFLYMEKFKDLNGFKKCVQSTLLRVNFLHFAGQWPEASTFLENDFKLDKNFGNLYSEYREYLDTEVHGKPLGIIKYE
jgi:hypothetical protein